MARRGGRRSGSVASSVRGGAACLANRHGGEQRAQRFCRAAGAGVGTTCRRRRPANPHGHPHGQPLRPWRTAGSVPPDPGQSGEVAVNDTIVTDSVKRFKWVGTRPIRPDGVPKVTGKALYGADYRLPGMLYGRILRSPHAHALIKSIDTSKAEALPGVKAVITA